MRLEGHEVGTVWKPLRERGLEGKRWLRLKALGGGRLGFFFN
jgi:hypothetical protein